MTLFDEFFEEDTSIEQKKKALCVILETFQKNVKHLLIEQDGAIEATELLCNSGYEQCINMLKKRLEARHDMIRDDLIANIGVMACAYIAYEMENVLLKEMLDDDTAEKE